MSAVWPPVQTPAQEEALLALASDYALAHGLVLRPVAEAGAGPSTTTAIHAPYALFPTPFPRALFAQAQRLQPLYNALYAQVTVDAPFLEEVVGGAVAKVDEFQGKLYDVWRQVEAEGVKQPLHLGLFRSDYLIHAPEGVALADASIKQVEFNTISSSFGPLATKVGDLHRYLAKAGAFPDVPELSLDNLPVNAALPGLVAGLAAGHQAYGVPSAKILMVVQDNERNAFDQRAMEWMLLENFNISLIRLPFSSLAQHTSIDPVTFALHVTHPSFRSSAAVEVSVVYYRAGYTPTDYPSDVEWATRLLIERSMAIKCPTVALQLAGAKKVQQVLAEPGRLDSFLEIGSTPSLLEPQPVAALTAGHAAELLASFTALYPMDDTPLGSAALELAYAHPERFVLKPQREGGGNNIYRFDIPPFLDALAEKDKSRASDAPKAREGYILMDLIEPPTGATSTMVRAGEAHGTSADVVSELGIYGVMLFKAQDGARGAEVLVNETVGHLVRTKSRASDEGGVAVGFSVIDSPCLV